MTSLDPNGIKVTGATMSGVGELRAPFAVDRRGVTWLAVRDGRMLARTVPGGGDLLPVDLVERTSGPLLPFDPLHPPGRLRWWWFALRAGLPRNYEPGMTADEIKDAEAFAACRCMKCQSKAAATQPWPSSLMRTMALCTQCGNKRCPKATDHANACTASNEPGQPGSAY